MFVGHRAVFAIVFVVYAFVAGVTNRAQAEPMVRLRVEAADLAGTPISAVDVGQDFLLKILCARLALNDEINIRSFRRLPRC